MAHECRGCSRHFRKESPGHDVGFREIVTIGNLGSNFAAAVDWVAEVIEEWRCSTTGNVQTADSTEHPLPDEGVRVWFTDPPYCDAVPYADLSDFFFVWLKRTLPGHPLLRDPYDLTNLLTPKTREAVQDETKKDDSRPKDRAWFEETMARAFAEGRRVFCEDGVGSVVFAHKTTEGWEAFLSGMIRGGWTITGSWPIATERPGRLRSQDSAALATSVHLVCRLRPNDAPVGDWGNVLGELPGRVGDWMERLQAEGIRGADLAFACIGPALEIFSRYSRVETADGQEVKLAEYLEKVWEVVGRTALEQVLGTAEARERNGTAGGSRKTPGLRPCSSGRSRAQTLMMPQGPKGPRPARRRLRTMREQNPQLRGRRKAIASSSMSRAASPSPWASSCPSGKARSSRPGRVSFACFR